MDTDFKLRSDFERIRSARAESRSAERLLAHYEVEHRLSRRLAQSNPAERTSLYSALYGELFDSVYDHPQHSGARVSRVEQIRGQTAVLLRWLTPASTYVEIGCGDAALTKVIGANVQAAIGVDVTEVLVSADAPATFRFIHSDGVSLKISTGSVDLVYSNQLMEHLHDDDALAQLREIYRILRPGGRYICSTPNRLTGPHDISVYFGFEPTGFHMREYDHRSLDRTLRSAGFEAVKAMVKLKGRAFVLPVSLPGAAEALLEMLPVSVRSRLALSAPVSNVFGVTLIGTK